MDASPAATRYRGDFVAWTGGCGFLGTGGGGGPIAPHSHYAIQLVIGAPAGLRVQFGRQGAWTSCAAALVPSRALHSIDVNACAWSAVLFIEPETAEGKVLSARLQGALEVLDGDATAQGASRLHAAWRVAQSEEATRSACQQLVRDLAQTPVREPSDPRVLAAVAHIREHLGQAITLADVAQAANLSPGRFRHLFVEQTGMPLRRYLLWRRLLQVWTLLMQGQTLSSAAHAAGFADSAHLSRTSRQMFGLAPSALYMSGPLSARARTPQPHRG